MSSSHPRASATLIQKLIEWRWLLLGLGVLITALSVPAARRVHFDRTIENMFSSSDPILRPYRRLKKRFGGNEIVLAVYRDAELRDREGGGLRRLSGVSKRLQSIKGVRDVLSLAELNEALESLFRLSKVLFPDADKRPVLFDPDLPIARQFLELFVGYTHSSNGQTAAIACMLEPPGEGVPQRRVTVDAIRAVMHDLPDKLEGGMIAGEPVMLVDSFRYVENDGRRLTTWSSLLLCIVLAFCFCPPRWALAVTVAAIVAAARWEDGLAAAALLAACLIAGYRPLRWVILPVCVVQSANFGTRAILAACGLRLSMVSSMLTAVIMVVGVAATVHVMIRFRDELDRHSDAASALRAALLVVAAPLTWACLTDALGFASLLLSRVGPVRDFGLMTSIGALATLVSILLFAPAVLLLGSASDEEHEGRVFKRLARALQQILSAALERKRAVLLILIVVVGFVSAGALWLEVETDFTRNFRDDSPIVRSYEFIEDDFGGAGVMDVILPAPPLLTEAFLERVRDLQAELREFKLPDAVGKPTRALTKVISLADALEASRAHPVLARLPAEARARGMASAMPSFAAALRTTTPDASGQHYFRIMLRANERQDASRKTRLINEVRRIVDRRWGDLEPGPETTGFFVLLTGLISSLTRDQWVCLAAAAVGVFAAMALALRSPRLALIALIPNVAPVLAVLGGMGWLGWRVNMGAAMIAAVSLGLSIDSSIHYLFDFRRAIEQGRTRLEAVGEAQSRVGRAVVLSTLALIVGFSALSISRFIPTAYFGALVSLALLGGLAGNLLLLPLLLATPSKR